MVLIGLAEFFLWVKQRKKLKHSRSEKALKWMDDELDVQFQKKNVVVILLMINLWYWKDLQRIFF